MRFAPIAAIVLLATAALAAAPSPETAWQASLKDDNKDWATAPHAILKIQDAAYLHDGQSATLEGMKGKPESYRWVAGDRAGVLIARVTQGKPMIVKDGKTYSEADIDKGIPVDTGIDVRGMTTQVEAGVIGARFFVYNQKNPAALAFKGVKYFPYDPAFAVQAAFTPDAKKQARVFRTSRGTSKAFYRVGEAAFTLKGRRFTLPFYADTNDSGKIDTMSAFFTDDLTGKGAYGSGRYVDVDKFGAFPPKEIAIDFNYAYNPNCALSPFYTCPVARDDLAIAITAGERDPHAH